jgi:putative ABC transport system permease protein
MTDLLDSLLRNLRLSFRSLARTPVFTATVVLTLALGIGANSAVFSAIYTVLLQPLPFPEGDRLVKVSQAGRRPNETFVAPPRLLDWSRLNSTFQAITGYYVEDSSELSGELPEKLRRAWVAPRFLEVWGIAPALGRDFTPQEERFGGPNAALISDRLWRRKFGADPGVVGKTLRFGRFSAAIVGVMPASFLFPDRDADIWSPSPMDAPYAQARESTWFVAVGRMKPGVTVEQARSNLAAVQAGLGQQYPKTDAALAVTVEPLKEVTVRGVRRSLWVLFAAVSLLLAIACTNIAALLLSRAAERRHEVSVRFSLGASRVSVVAGLLTEVFVLAVAGAVAGLVLASMVSGVFRALASDLPRIEEIRLNGRIVLYSLACAVTVTLASGLFPAVAGTRRELSGSLAETGRAQVAGRNRTQWVLVGIQVALAVTLLSGAALLARSLQELGRVSPGFEADHVLTFHLTTTWGETGDPKASRQRMERLLETLTAIPGVEVAANTISLPGVPTKYQVEVQTVPARAESEPKMIAESRWVSPGYFAVMRIQVMAGELCRDETGVSTAMVNRSFANAYFAGAAAIGHSLIQPANPYSRPSVIRGIVADARETGLDRAPVPTVYGCGGTSQPGTFLVLRTRAEPMSIAETVRRAIREIEPARSVYDLTPLSSHISDSYAQNRLRTFLLVFFAGTAVSLACVGLYGTLSYLVTARRRELGLRLALGAMRGQIVRHFLGQGLAVSLLGGAAGVALAAGSTRLLSGMLYGVSASDAATWGLVLAVVLGVAAAASLAPALRAARLDPMTVLRDE